MRHLAVWAAALLPAVALSQTPNTGDALRDAEQRPLTLPPRQSIELNLPDAPAAEVSNSGPQLAVNDFVIEGNRAISSEEIQPLLADLRGRKSSLGELQAGANRITRLYREHGYPLARAYLPAQEIDAGVVKIQVLEGRFGEVRLDNNARLRGPALAPLSALESGAAVKASTLERSLLLLQDVPGVTVQATLQPGLDVGSTDIDVQIDRARRVSGELALDNFGNEFVGEYRLGGAVSLENPLRLGDELSLRGLYSDEDQQYLRLAYELPIASGTRFGISYTDMDYQLAGDFEDLDVNGSAKIPAAFLSQALIRSRDFSLYAQLQYEDKKLEDRVGLFDMTTRKQAELASLTVSGNGQDRVFGGGLNSFSASWSRGDLEIDSALDRLIDALTAKTAGRFNKYNLGLLRLQRLSDRFNVQVQASAQWADGNLDSAEKLSLGGANGIRAYSQGEGAGDEGWLANVELQYALLPQWQLATFYDQGAVKINKNPWTSADNDRDLSGAGVAVRWLADGWRLDALVSWDLGDEPQRDESSPRFWTRMVKSF